VDLDHDLEKDIKQIQFRKINALLLAVAAGPDADVHHVGCPLEFPMNSMSISSWVLLSPDIS
jgi:hypothetical protein